METLADVLELFNRKERNLLIRDLLGHAAKPLQISDQFRNRLTTALALPRTVPGDAWWATDYHIEWLAGALLTFMKGDSAPTKRDSELIKGDQEDIDLVIAAGDDLILIEAKAYGYFGSEQYGSKMGRLERLYDFYKKLEGQSPRRVHFHLLLCSPNEPIKLDLKRLPWATNHPTNCSKVRWMKLEIPSPKRSILAVTRCDVQGKRAAKGEFWRCFEIKHGVPRPPRGQQAPSSEVPGM